MLVVLRSLYARMVFRPLVKLEISLRDRQPQKWPWKHTTTFIASSARITNCVWKMWKLLRRSFVDRSSKAWEVSGIQFSLLVSDPFHFWERKKCQPRHESWDEPEALEDKSQFQSHTGWREKKRKNDCSRESSEKTATEELILIDERFRHSTLRIRRIMRGFKAALGYDFNYSTTFHSVRWRHDLKVRSRFTRGRINRSNFYSHRKRIPNFQWNLLPRNFANFTREINLFTFHFNS